MGGNDNSKVNAAYVASWKQANPKLFDLKTDGNFLYYYDEKLDIRGIYMQDLLRNSNLFYSMNSIEADDLFNLIKIHVYAIKIKETELKEKVRRLNEYEYYS